MKRLLSIALIAAILLSFGTFAPALGEQSSGTQSSDAQPANTPVAGTGSSDTQPSGTPVAGKQSSGTKTIDVPLETRIVFKHASFYDFGFPLDKAFGSYGYSTVYALDGKELEIESSAENIASISVYGHLDAGSELDLSSHPLEKIIVNAKSYAYDLSKLDSAPWDASFNNECAYILYVVTVDGFERLFKLYLVEGAPPDDNGIDYNRPVFLCSFVQGVETMEQNASTFAVKPLSARFTSRAGIANISLYTLADDYAYGVLIDSEDYDGRESVDVLDWFDKCGFDFCELVCTDINGGVGGTRIEMDIQNADFNIDIGMNLVGLDSGGSNIFADRQIIPEFYSHEALVFDREDARDFDLEISYSCDKNAPLPLKVQIYAFKVFNSDGHVFDETFSFDAANNYFYLKVKDIFKDLEPGYYQVNSNFARRSGGGFGSALFVGIGQGRTLTNADIINFPDMPEDPWADNAIGICVDKEVLKGYEDGTLRPDGQVTRNEFAKMLAEGLNIPVKTHATTSFEDAQAWATDYVEAVKGFMPGYAEDGRHIFKGDDAAIREDMAAALVKALNIDVGDAGADADADADAYADANNNNGDADADAGASAGTDADASADAISIELAGIFSDWEKISPKNRPYVLAAYKEHLISGYPGGWFGPDRTITRAEAAMLISNAIKSDKMTMVFGETTA